ncbi:MAG: response regulator transcription factor [Pseudomonadota bacterium]
MVEDEPSFSTATVSCLKRAGYCVDLVDSVVDAVSAVAIYAYDLVLLDRCLPDGDGLSFMRNLRRSRNDVPIILMSASMAGPQERIMGLEDGADDYIGKPCDSDELLARVRALLRRPRQIAENEVAVGNLRFDLSSRNVTIDGTPIPIARRELAMLEHLVRGRGRVVLREQMEQSVYGFDESVSINAIDVSMHRLRRTLAKHGAHIHVHTVRGLGFILQAKALADV